ncbi:MAG TPA: hypothetical protein VFA59_10745 [Vicinamibacterales bacterium]|nr:hypothetical protein [Vicinamibacterales bacterium]
MSAVRTRDVDMCQGMLADSFFAVVARRGSPLETVTKSAWLKHVRSGGFDEFAANDIHVRAHRRVAVATIMCADELVTDIWIERGGHWAMGERHIAQLTR